MSLCARQNVRLFQGVFVKLLHFIEPKMQSSVQIDSQKICSNFSKSVQIFQKSVQILQVGYPSLSQISVLIRIVVLFGG